MSIAIFKKGKGKFGNDQTAKVDKSDIYLLRLPQSTADLINNGEDGINPFISALDLLSNNNNVIISGNGVTLISGYKFNVAAHKYAIRGRIYDNPITEITLTDADPSPTIHRIDVIVGTFDSQGNGVIAVVEGQSSATPIKPTINEDTQIEITFIYVTGNTTTVVEVVNEVVYEENVEYVTSDNTGGARVNFVSAVTPNSGSVCIEMTGFTTGDEMAFQAPAPFSPHDYSFLRFYIIPTDEIGWENRGKIQIAFFSGSDIKSNWIIIDSLLQNKAGNPYAFNSKLIAWQNVSIPIDAFGLGSDLIDKIIIQKQDGRGSDSWRLDTIGFQTGISAKPPLSKNKLSQFINDGDGDINDPFVTLSVAGVLKDLTAGLYIVIDKTDPTNYVISAIPSTSAGILGNTYFTADEEITGAGTFYKALKGDKGILAEASQTIAVDDNQKLFFAQDLLGEVRIADTVSYGGDYTGFLSVEHTVTTARVRFTVEIYRADSDGNVLASGVTGAPVGDLGVTVMTIMDTGSIQLSADQITQVNMTGFLAENVTLLTGQRARAHISGEKIGTVDAVITLKLYFGSDHNSYIIVPVGVTTDTVVNESIVTGATATDALDSLQNQVTGLDGANIAYINAINDFNVEQSLLEGLKIPDAKLIKLGTGDDFQLYHNVDSFIDSITGVLKLRQRFNGGLLELITNDGVGTEKVQLRANGTTKALELFFDAVSKLITSATGVDITGQLLADTIAKTSGTGDQFLIADGSVKTEYQVNLDVRKQGLITTDYTLINTDHNKHLWVSAAVPIEITVDLFLLPTDFYVRIENLNPFQVVFRGGALEIPQSTNNPIYLVGNALNQNDIAEIRKYQSSSRLRLRGDLSYEQAIGDFQARVVADSGTFENPEVLIYRDSLASFELFPNAFKATKLYSLTPNDGVGDFTVARACKASRINKHRVLEFMDNDVVRIDYSTGKGLILFEKGSANLALWSEPTVSDLAVATNVSDIITDGVNGIYHATNNDSSSYVDVSGTTINNTYTLSMYIETFDSNPLVVNDFTLILDNTAILDPSVTIENVRNNLYRVYGVKAVTLNNTFAGIRKLLGDNSRPIAVSRIQLEEQFAPTSYMKTEGSIFTRFADEVSGAGDVTTFNEEGVIYTEIQLSEFPTATNNWITISDGTINNFAALVFDVGSLLVGRNTVGGVTQSLITYAIDYSQKLKIAFKFKVNDFALWVNGVEVGSDLLGSVPPANTFNTLQFSYPTGTNNIESLMEAFRVYNTALTDPQLAELTSIGFITS